MRKLIHVFVLLLIILSPGMALIPAPVSGQHPLKTDTDGDGIPDSWEDEHGLNPDDAHDASFDYNYNERTNLQEYKNGSDPWDMDTDDDGISNYAECWALFGFFTDPFASDTDTDGLSDLKEICMYIDTGDETRMIEIYPDKTNRTSLREDITNLSRTYPYELDPTNSDVDGDGLNDGDEITKGANPNCVDSDLDGLRDGDEVHNYSTNATKRDTDGDGLLDSEEVFGTYGVVTDPTKRDTDGDGISDGEEILGFGFAPIEPSERVLTYEEFISGAYGVENITLKAKVDSLRFSSDQSNYWVFLKPLESVDSTEGKRGVARVNSSWHYDFEHGEMARVDNRFNFSLRGGDTIVIVGKAGNFLGNTREIEVGSNGKLYLVLTPEEAIKRWLPSKKYVKILSEHGVTTVTPLPSPAPSSTSTPAPSSSPTPTPTSTSTPLPSPVNETNETAADESGAEGRGIFRLLGYVVIVIVIASLILYAKFDRSRRSRKVRQEDKGGKGGKPSAEVSGMQKGGRKEWG
jgi:hypothetical protein